MKSEYNTGDVMDIDRLTDDQKKQAFHEWAEGSPALEELFLSCDDKGIKTLASCSGDPERHDKQIEYLGKDYQMHMSEVTPRPYVVIIIEEFQEEYLKSMYDRLVSSKEDCEIELSIHPNIGKMVFSVFCNLKNREDMFSLISQSIREPSKEIEHLKEYNKFRNAFDKMQKLLQGTKREGEAISCENCQDSPRKKKQERMNLALYVRKKLLIEKLKEKLPFHKQKLLDEPKNLAHEEKAEEMQPKPIENPLQLQPEALKEFNQKAKEIMTQSDKEENSEAKDTIQENNETLR